MHIRDRIKELRRVPVSQLAPSPRNWRTHPKSQRDALRGVLAEIGIADAVLAREREDGMLELIDGHCRAELLPDAILPVLILDVTQEEADKLLLTLDPLGAMADANQAKLDALLQEAKMSNPAIQAMLDSLAQQHGILSADEADDDADAAEPVVIPQQYQILIDCQTEEEQVALLERLSAEGVQCRSLIS